MQILASYQQWVPKDKLLFIKTIFEAILIQETDDDNLRLFWDTD